MHQKMKFKKNIHIHVTELSYTMFVLFDIKSVRFHHHLMFFGQRNRSFKWWTFIFFLNISPQLTDASMHFNKKKIVTLKYACSSHHIVMRNVCADSSIRLILNLDEVDKTNGNHLLLNFTSNFQYMSWFR